MEPSLEEVRQRHPGFDIAEVFGGYLAVTRGASVLRAAFLQALDERLAAEEAAGAGPPRRADRADQAGHPVARGKPCTRHDTP